MSTAGSCWSNPLPEEERRQRRSRTADHARMDIVHALKLSGGAARRSVLFTMGFTKADLMRAYARGLIENPHRGVYVLPSAPADVVGARIWSGGLTCASWCRVHGITVWGDDARVHVVVGGHRGIGARDRRERGGAVLHYHGNPGRDDSAIAALDALGACLGPVTQIIAVDEALRAGMLSAKHLENFTMTPALQVMRLKLHAEASAGSPAETLARIALREAGLSFVSQVGIGGVGRVDFLVEDVLVVEIDGRSFHSSTKDFVRDRRRDRAALRNGFPVIRFAAAEVFGSAHGVAEEVVELVKTLKARRAA